MTIHAVVPNPLRNRIAPHPKEKCLVSNCLLTKRIAKSAMEWTCSLLLLCNGQKSFSKQLLKYKGSSGQVSAPD